MKNVLVVGSVNIDMTMKMDKVPAPGQCLIADDISKAVGGKGLNQSVAVARQGESVTFVGKVGIDDDAQIIKEKLRESGISSHLLYSKEKSTGIAYILLESNSQNRIIVYGGANQDYNTDDLDEICRLIDSHDVLLVQLEISLPILYKIIQYATEKNKLIVVDCGPAKPGILHYFNGVNIVSPNETELAILTGIDGNSLDDRLNACQMLLNYGAHAVLLKLGAEGSMWVTSDGYKYYPAYSGITAVDSTGAGDSFTAAFTASYMNEKDVDKAINYATAAGALAVTKMGALDSMPTKEETLDFMK